VDDPTQDEEARAIAIGAAGSVLDGPMAGWQGIVTRSRRDRLTLLLSLFGRQVTAEFHPRQVEAV
jgi:transcription antitermination factor NusG